jgi:sulfopyruvate decarboxylase TPP-binding subunit
LKRAEIRQVGYVPDAGHVRLIELCRDDPDIRAVPLTSEEEGVALLAGAACGFEEAFEITDELGLREFVAKLHHSAVSLFACVAIRADEPPRVLPPRDGVLLKNRFRRLTGAEP